MVKQKQNNHALSIKSDVLHYHYTRMKRLLQYSQSFAKNNHTPFALAYLTSHSLSSSLLYSSLLSTHEPTAFTMHQATLARISYLVHRLCFSLLGMSASLMPMHLWLACIHYMHALHLVSTTYTLPYCTCILLISCFVSLCILYMILATLCSVLVQRTSRQSSLCRCLATSAQHPLPVMLAMHLHYNSLVQDTRVNLRRTLESYKAQETACMMDIV